MSHKKKLLLKGLLLGTAGAALALVPAFLPTALALGVVGGAGGTVRGSLGDQLVALASNVAAINTFFQILLLMILDFLGYLLQADFFTNAAMNSALIEIWKLSRDIMNLIFALLLIGVAFYTIITGKSQYVKDKLMTFVIAVVLVNFSWFFPRVIIDVANVLTATIYSVPNMLPGFTCVTIDDTSGSVIPCKVVTDKLVFGTDSQQGTWQDDHCGTRTDPNCPCQKGIGCYKKEPLAAVAGTMAPAHAMINGIAVSFARVTELSQIPAGFLALGGSATTGQGVMVSFQVLMNIFMVFLIQLGVILPLLGLAVGFLIRILILWVTTVFMPFTFLGYLINGKLGTNVFGFEFDIWHEFINAAFLPAVVAIPMVIGFIMLSTSASIPAPGGGFSTWAVPIISGVKTWWALLWMFAAIIILWKGSFAALSKSKVIGGITEKIKGFGESIFRGAIQLPLLMPLPFPGPGGMTMTPGKLLYGPKMMSEAIQLGARQGKSFKDLKDDAFGLGGGAHAAGVASAVKNINSDPVNNTQRIVNAINGLKGATTPADRDRHLGAIQTAMGHRQGQTSVQSLEYLKDIVQNSRIPSLTVNIADIETELNKERAKKP
jgi:hypothetical protein